MHILVERLFSLGVLIRKGRAYGIFFLCVGLALLVLPFVAIHTVDHALSQCHLTPDRLAEMRAKAESANSLENAKRQTNALIDSMEGAAEVIAGFGQVCRSALLFIPFCGLISILNALLFFRSRALAIESETARSDAERSMKTKRKSGKPGAATSVEVSHVSPLGIWLLLGEKEYFLTFEDFPWFAEAKIREIHRVELAGENHLRWPALDVDLCLESIRAPENFPLVDHA